MALSSARGKLIGVIGDEVIMSIIRMMVDHDYPDYPE
jgi:hypothetical protein